MVKSRSRSLLGKEERRKKKNSGGGGGERLLVGRGRGEGTQDGEEEGRRRLGVTFWQLPSAACCIATVAELKSLSCKTRQHNSVAASVHAVGIT